MLLYQNMLLYHTSTQPTVNMLLYHVWQVHNPQCKYVTSVNMLLYHVWQVPQCKYVIISRLTSTQPTV